MIRRAISPLLAIRRLSNIGAIALHPEHAEARPFRNGCIKAGRKCQTEDIARLLRIYDPVIPKPRGGIIRIALGFVISADGCLESLLLFARPAFAFGLQPIPADGC